MINSILTINKNGTCCIPIAMRRLMRLKPGTKLIISLQEQKSGDKIIVLKPRKGAAINE